VPKHSGTVSHLTLKTPLWVHVLRIRQRMEQKLSVLPEVRLLINAELRFNHQSLYFKFNSILY